MKIVPQSADVHFYFPFRYCEKDEAFYPTGTPENIIELAARVCHKSEDKICAGSTERIIKIIHKKEHTSIFEHAFATVFFVTDRAIATELRTHRIASFAQESTRYCSYDKGKFDGELTFIEPPGLVDEARQIWEETCKVSEHNYMAMRKLGTEAQLARSVLLLSLKAEIIVSANFREWYHIFNLRTADDAHPQIKLLIDEARKQFVAAFPTVFAYPGAK